MSRFVRVVAVGAVTAGLTVGLGSLVGCSGTSSPDKMKDGKMMDDKMGGDKMKDGKMMEGDKMKDDKMKGDKASPK